MWILEGKTQSLNDIDFDDLSLSSGKKMGSYCSNLSCRISSSFSFYFPYMKDKSQDTCYLFLPTKHIQSSEWAVQYAQATVPCSNAWTYTKQSMEYAMEEV